MPTIVITGASDGIGAAGARQLKGRGHDVVLVGRNQAKTAALARELNAPFHTADYTRLSDVKRLAAELGELGRIDVLVNNAGGIMGPRELTADGFEKSFQVNHLAAFLLTRLLLPRLVASRARVIQTASAAANMFGGRFDTADLNNERNYTPLGAYGRSKLANILFTRELDRRHHADGLAAVAFHPGVVRTNFASETTPMMRLVYHSPLKYLLPLSPARSAQRLVRLAEGAPGTDWQPGACYAGQRPMKVVYQDDGTAARLLWEQSEAFVKPWLA
ncbi:SDR family NAD(P)-dependent oxidoreductase [Bradyrhizobium sp. STM 3809]|uniref:SDR family NAD(P)-dependent oxidoreductase n=1 Tax=Bradyrhizobium sp. STM 3809 TaxID=551936 RepID=UPI000240987B|nr:SDR family NAD(P)-dependent oxidoreductase [Bradyrhizobium sp. STM 3809]CCE01776.1 Short-chain dehydrogenase/reductase SDR [Bradyrhizobium sp. STM 3809]